MGKIMVVAGGVWQVDLIKKAKSMGHYVICSNLYEDSPAFPYADACEVADVLDKERNLQIAKKYMPDAVISDQSDIAVPTVAYLNDKLGLCGISPEKADLFTDKALQRQACLEKGIAIPDFKICETAEDAIPMLEQYGTIVIKPIDSQSSRGVHTIRSKEDLEKNCNDAIAWSNRRRAFLAEEYMDGDEFTIDGLVVNGHHYPLCISVKEMYPEKPNISRMQAYSYLSEKYDYGLLRATNQKLIETLQLPMGLTHCEYKAYKGKFYLVEAGARGGGSNLSSKIVPFMSGIDNYEYLIKEALGERVDEDNVRQHLFSDEKYVIMRFFDFGEGVVESIEGLEILEHHPMMLDYRIEIHPGDTIRQPAYGRLRPGHFIIGGFGKEFVEKEAEKILDTVKVKFR